MQEVTVHVKRLHDDAVLPRYARAGDAGLDLVSVGSPVTLAPGARALVPTGLAIALPEGYELQIRPRSGFALKEGITVLNSPGTVDSGYRGELGVIVFNANRDRTVTIEAGTRIAQAVLARYEHLVWDELAELPGSERGAAGFGSTGKGERP